MQYMTMNYGNMPYAVYGQMVPVPNAPYMPMGMPCFFWGFGKL